MTPGPPAEPSPRALGESLAALAVQLADLRGQVSAISDRLDQAGLRPGLNLAARFEDLARTVTGALEAAARRGPPRPTGPAWTATPTPPSSPTCGGGPSTVLRPHYGGYELRDCWPRHTQAIWELSTLAAEWHRTYSANRPDLARALEFYDRWLPAPCAASPASPAPTCRSASCSRPRRLGCPSRIPLIPAPRRIPRRAPTAGASRTITRTGHAGHRPAVWGGHLPARHQWRAGSTCRAG